MVALAEGTVPTGQELLAQFIQYGNQQPFEEIVRRYAGMVFNVCYRITKDKHEAEDATQAVFLTLALQARRGADIKALGPWLQQVAKRLSLDTRRSKKRRKTREERHQVEQTIRRETILGDTLPSADMDEVKTILHEELQKLPAKYRMPLILHYFGGLTRDEMAAELNCKPSTLGVRIFRGREMLAGRLSGRGINISTGVLAAMLGCAVKNAVSHALITSTSHAGTAIMAGYDGSGFASANVIGLTRRATSALAFGKVRVSAITLMMAATSMGAGAKALGILPQINIQQMISNQMNRMLRPLLNPVTPSFRVDAQTLPGKTVAPQPQSIAFDANLVQLIAPKLATPIVHPASPIAQLASALSPTNGVVNFANSPLQTVFKNPMTRSSGWVDPTPMPSIDESDRSPLSSGSVEPIEATASTGTSGSASAGVMGGGAASQSGTSLPTRAPVAFAGHLPQLTLSTNDLIVGFANVASTSSSQISGNSKNQTTSADASPASQIAMIQIPAINGTVIQSSTGVLRGYGKVDRTGKLVLNSNGKVVADGSGIDRTFDLSSFSSVQTSDSLTALQSTTSSTLSPAGTGGASPYMSVASQAPAPMPNPNASADIAARINTAGWYAVDHGRLSLSLQTGADKSILTWGEDPNATKLNLVNSVRLNLNTISNTAGSASDNPSLTMPAELALLSPDRTDAPHLGQLDGVPIGLWQVDPSAGALPSADITVCYDGLLAAELGAPPSSIDLWTLGGAPGASWQAADPSSMLLDTTDHLISGYADDISYFAVTAAAAPGTDVDRLVADHLSIVGGRQTLSIPSGVSGVPEPTTLLPLLAASAGLLGRRRRA